MCILHNYYYTYIQIYICVCTHALLCSYYNDDDISVCYTSCNGYEDELIDCYIDISHWCQCDVVVSITCSK